MSAGSELLSDIGRSGVQIFTGHKTHTWSLIADGNEEATTVTVPGAALGNQCLVSLSIDVADIALDAQVTAANIVTVVALNNTGGNITLGASTIYVTVLTFAPN
jgi:hypothetical protein